MIKPGDPLIQSYVRRKYFVSTMLRRSSAMIIPAPRYYETCVFELDENMMATDMLAQVDSGNDPIKAVDDHMKLCLQMHTKIMQDEVEDITQG